MRIRDLTAAAALLLATAMPTQASLLLSTSSAAGGGGVTWSSGDGVTYDQGTGAFSLTLDGSGIFTGSENIDALTRLGDAFILSTTTDALVNGLAVRDGDLVLWDPGTSTTALFFSEDLFGGTDEDVDGAHLFDDGGLALTTTSSATLGGLSFRSRDVVHYDPIADLATLLFDGDLFDTASENVDAVTLDHLGLLALSTSTDAVIQGVSVLEGDLWRYDPGNGSVTTIFPESSFDTAGEDLDAAHLTAPAPSTPLLLLITMPVLIRLTRSKT